MFTIYTVYGRVLGEARFPGTALCLHLVDSHSTCPVLCCPIDETGKIVRKHRVENIESLLEETGTLSQRGRRRSCGRKRLQFTYSTVLVIYRVSHIFIFIFSNVRHGLEFFHSCSLSLIPRLVANWWAWSVQMQRLLSTPTPNLS